MWGNWLGWLLSALSVLAAVLFINWMSAVAERVAPRTDASSGPQISAIIELPVSPESVLRGISDRADTAPIYRRAIAQYLQNPFTYDAFTRAGKAGDIEKIPAIKILTEATNSRNAKLFSENPAEIITFTNEKPALDGLRTLGICARRAGQLIEAQNPAEAMKLYEAAFSLGAKLYLERITWAELEIGLNLMAENGKMILALATKTGDSARADAARQFDQARINYTNKNLLPTQHIISSVDAILIEQHAGDIAYFARYARDRMWRVESILALGRMRFSAARPGDQRTAMRVIQQFTSDSDPAIRAAAIAARDLTLEQYRMLH